jgi:hypothetical protein
VGKFFMAWPGPSILVASPYLKDPSFAFICRAFTPIIVPQVMKVMSCVLLLLKQPENWSTARILLGNSKTNKDLDERALVEDYDLKIVHMMKTYNVFDYTKDVDMLVSQPPSCCPNPGVPSLGPLPVLFGSSLITCLLIQSQSRAEIILKHPRFASDNLAIQAFGMGLAFLVDFCKVQIQPLATR